MEFIKNNIYYFLFIGLLIEWPIVGFIGWEYASQWKLNIVLFFILAVIADIIWDVCVYSCWRFFNNRKYIDRFSHIKMIKNYINEKKFFQKLLTDIPFVFFLIVKITPYVSTPSLFSVWIKKYHFRKFLFFSALVSCIVKFVYISLWYLWWISLAKLKLIQEWWSELILFVIIGIGAFCLIKLLLKKFSKRLTSRMKEILHKF